MRETDRHAYCKYCKHRIMPGVCYNDCCVDGNRFEDIEEKNDVYYGQRT